MAEPGASEGSSASPEDAFGPPHAQKVADSLQMWILIPGLLILLVVGTEIVCHHLCIFVYVGVGDVCVREREGEGGRERL